MARSPFQGTFRSGVRPTVVTAPDALAFINGELDVLGCPQCNRRFDLNQYITSIQVDLNIDSPPGTATISLSIPRHTIDDFMFDGVPLVSPMMEVELFAKGHFLVEGMPQYYPIFWGLVTEVSESYSGGEHTVAINCADILKWWELCQMNINPAYTQPKGQGGFSIFGNVFFGTNPYDMIWTLAQQSFGDVVIGTGSLQALYKEQGAQRNVFNNALGSIMQYWNERFTRIRSNLLLYGAGGVAVRGDLLWETFKNNRGQPKNLASKAVRQANGGDSASQMTFDPTDPGVVAFRTQTSQAGQVNFWQSEYQTKLELANAAKEVIGFEFYMDVTGDIVFKPPFYNLDVLSNKPISWIQDIDIIDWDFGESEAEVFTQLQLQGNATGAVDWGMPEEMTPYTSVTDYHLLRKYGWRTHTYNSEFMGNNLNLMFITGLDILDRLNSRRHRGTVNIPLRPELRLGFPVYVGPKDQVWYTQGISHNIQFGGRAQTTLTLTARRQKFLAPKGIGTLKLTGFGSAQARKAGKLGIAETTKPSSRQLAASGQFELKVGAAAQVPPTEASQDELIRATGENPFEPLLLRHPKTGRIVGYPNVVMAYTRPFAAPPNRIRRAAGQKENPTKNTKATADLRKAQQAGIEQAAKQSDDYLSQFAFTREDELREKHLANRYSYGINSAGVYTYAHDTSEVVDEILMLPSSRVTVNDDSVAVGANANAKGKNRTGMIRPVSDERGFEVIGHFRYGRGIGLKDGSLILDPGNLNKRAQVDAQLALSGGLFETLDAQSQGITTVTSAFASPAETIAKLSPDPDLQTAGMLNPETREPEFRDEGVNLVDARPLGSREEQGVPTKDGGQNNPAAALEASQLSRALTLAEMQVRDDLLPREECICLTGRSDLAFINAGLTIKTLKGFGSTTDDSSLPVVTIDGLGAADPGEDAIRRATEASKAAGTAAAQAAEEDPVSLSETPEQTNKRIDQARATAELDAQAELLEPLLNQQTEATAEAGLRKAQQEGRPVSAAVFTLTQLTEAGLPKVEEFLVRLYAALDRPHQELEKELRGETTAASQAAANRANPFGTAPTLSPLEPPFSTPARALGGNPEALARSAASAVGDLKKSWTEFGEKLQSTGKKAALNGEIVRSERTIATLQAEQTRLEEQIANNEQGVIDITLTPEGGTSSRLEEVNKQLGEERQTLSKNQLKLNQLNQEFPP